MGSDSDLEIMREAAKILDEFGISYEMDVTSAHRSPARTSEYASQAAGRGVRVVGRMPPNLRWPMVCFGAKR